MLEMCGNTPLLHSINQGNVPAADSIFLCLNKLEADKTILSANSLNKNNLLHCAILSSDSATISNVIQVLDYHSSTFDGIQNIYNECNSSGQTALHLVIKQKKLPGLAAYLIKENKCDLTIQDNDANTALHLAIINNDSYLLRCIMGVPDSHKILNLPNNGGETPLYLAARNGNPKTIALLLNSGAVANQDEESPSPLIVAIAKRHPEAVKILLDSKQFIPNSAGNPPLHYLAATKNKNDGKAGVYVQHNPLNELIGLLKNDINLPNKQGNTPLHIAIQRNNYKVAFALINAGADLNIANLEKQDTPLHLALYMANSTFLEIKNKNEQIIALSLAKKELTIQLGNLNENDTTLEIKRVSYYDERRKNIRENIKNTKKALTRIKRDVPLCQSAINNLKSQEAHLTPLIEHLVKNGASTGLKNSLGNSATKLASQTPSYEVKVAVNGIDWINNQTVLLEVAIESGKAQELFKILAALGDVNFKNMLGETSLHLAIKFKQFRLAQQLINARADVNILNNAGESPLQIATKNNSCEGIELLCKSGANINAKRAFRGHTPLHIAVENKNYNTAKKLISLKANLNATDDYGKTPEKHANYKSWTSEFKRALSECSIAAPQSHPKSNQGLSQEVIIKIVKEHQYHKSLYLAAHLHFFLIQQDTYNIE